MAYPLPSIVFNDDGEGDWEQDLECEEHIEKSAPSVQGVFDPEGDPSRKIQGAHFEQGDPRRVFPAWPDAGRKGSE